MGVSTALVSSMNLNHTTKEVYGTVVGQISFVALHQYHCENSVSILYNPLKSTWVILATLHSAEVFLCYRCKRPECYLVVK